MKRGVAAKLLPSCACFCVPRINPRVNGGEFCFFCCFFFRLFCTRGIFMFSVHKLLKKNDKANLKQKLYIYMFVVNF